MYPYLLSRNAYKGPGNILGTYYTEAESLCSAIYVSTYPLLEPHYNPSFSAFISNSTMNHQTMHGIAQFNFFCQKSHCVMSTNHILHYQHVYPVL